MPCSRGSGDPKGETHVRDGCLSTGTLRVYPPARASLWTRLRLAFANDSTATQNSSLRTIEEVPGAKLGPIELKNPAESFSRGPDGPHVLLRSIYLTQIEVVDKPSDSHRPSDQLPARNRAPTGVWPPFSLSAAGWRLDWDPPSFAGPFFSIAVAMNVALKDQ